MLTLTTLIKLAHTGRTMIQQMNLTIANSYLVRTEKLILIDTGAPGSTRRIVQRLNRLGVAAQDIGLILLTHAHSDHAGSAKALRQLTGAPVAVHQDDAAMLRAGNNGHMLPVGLEARFSQAFVDKPFPALEPDIMLTSSSDLAHYDVQARMLSTPGHTPGSISLIFDSGDAVVGDILRGGLMGGNFLPQKPNYPYFLYDNAHKATLLASIRQVLDAGAKRLFVGHGGPLHRTNVEAWLDRQK
jgi:glyoxylase-like metal-dependent hydrolase (beta-lactamase superfamily II)